jgi:hypothetical protein
MERGAVLAEAALVLPVLALLLFGILEYGLLFRSNLTVAEATRSGARVGAAMPRQPDMLAATAEATAGRLVASGVPEDQIRRLVIYRADPTTGGLDGGGSTDAAIEACSTDCVRYAWDGTTDRFLPVTGSPTWSAASQEACGGIGDTDYVGVYLRVRHEFVTGMFGSGVTITERSIMRLEPMSTSVACKP